MQLFALALIVALSGGITRAEEPAIVKGVVLDAKTSAPIPYVNIGVPNEGVGTVADAKGQFTLAGVRTAASILFTANAYEPFAVPRASFPESGEIRLSPIGRGFHEQVSVTANAPADAKIFGHAYEGRGYGVGFGSALLGSEIGARIKIDKPTFIESASFTVAHTGGENFLYRVNVYDFSGEEVGEKLLKHDVILEAEQKRGTMTVDLREQNFVVKNDVLLTLEWIRGDLEMGNSNVMFRGRSGTKANLYLKLTSQMPFQQIKRNGLGFYLKGHVLK